MLLKERNLKKNYFISQSRLKLRQLNEEINGKNKTSISEETVTSIDYIKEEVVYDIQTGSGKFLANEKLCIIVLFSR